MKRWLALNDGTDEIFNISFIEGETFREAIYSSLVDSMVAYPFDEVEVNFGVVVSRSYREVDENLSDEDLHHLIDDQNNNYNIHIPDEEFKTIQEIDPQLDRELEGYQQTLSANPDIFSDMKYSFSPLEMEMIIQAMDICIKKGRFNLTRSTERKAKEILEKLEDL